MREEMGVLGLTVEDVNERGRWKRTICSGEKPKGEEDPQLLQHNGQSS